MSHHFNQQGQFQSDQYPNLAPDEIVLSFKDPVAIDALNVFADMTDDDELAVAIVKRLDAIAGKHIQEWEHLDESARRKTTCVKWMMGLECGPSVRGNPRQ